MGERAQGYAGALSCRVHRGAALADGPRQQTEGDCVDDEGIENSRGRRGGDIWRFDGRSRRGGRGRAVLCWWVSEQVEAERGSGKAAGGGATPPREKILILLLFLRTPQNERGRVDGI